MADISSDRVIYETDIIINANTTVEFGKSYLITTASTVTLPNLNMINGGEITFKKYQNIEPRITVLGGSGHNIRIQNQTTDNEIIFDIDAEIKLIWKDSDLRWEV